MWSVDGCDGNIAVAILGKSSFKGGLGKISVSFYSAFMIVPFQNSIYFHILKDDCFSPYVMPAVLTRNTGKRQATRKKAQSGPLLKFDLYNFVLLIEVPYLTPSSPEPGRNTETAPGRASRELHPSEDLSELPPLLVSVAGQEYQGRCCCGKTTCQSCFWDRRNRSRLFKSRRSWRVFPRRLPVFSRHTGERISDSEYAIDKVRKGRGKAPHF